MIKIEISKMRDQDIAYEKAHAFIPDKLEFTHNTYK